MYDIIPPQVIHLSAVVTGFADCAYDKSLRHMNVQRV